MPWFRSLCATSALFVSLCWMAAKLYSPLGQRTQRLHGEFQIRTTVELETAGGGNGSRKADQPIDRKKATIITIRRLLLLVYQTECTPIRCCGCGVLDDCDDGGVDERAGACVHVCRACSCRACLAAWSCCYLSFELRIQHFPGR
jgi:hypothetical protein